MRRLYLEGETASSRFQARSKLMAKLLGSFRFLREAMHRTVHTILSPVLQRWDWNKQRA